MDEQQDSLVELVDEEGNPTQFQHLATLEHEGENYVLLCAADEDGDEEDEEGEEGEEGEKDVFILRIARDESGEDCYVSVDDEELLDAVFEKFMELVGQEEEEA